ncbi:GNAT family N-acetyltransferase [Roseburia hominis]
MQTGRVRQEEISEVSALMCRNFLEVNIRDYPRAMMEELAGSHTPEKVAEIAKNGHMYVVRSEEGRILGTGTICMMEGSETDSYIMSVSVLPEYQGKGIGRRIMEALEQDELFRSTRRTELHASITAHQFYEALGYHYMKGKESPNELGLYDMEKKREEL